MRANDIWIAALEGSIGRSAPVTLPYWHPVSAMPPTTTPADEVKSSIECYTPYNIMYYPVSCDGGEVFRLDAHYAVHASPPMGVSTWNARRMDGSSISPPLSCDTFSHDSAFVDPECVPLEYPPPNDAKMTGLGSMRSSSNFVSDAPPPVDHARDKISGIVQVGRK